MTDPGSVGELPAVVDRLERGGLHRDAFGECRPADRAVLAFQRIPHRRIERGLDAEEGIEVAGKTGTAEKSIDPGDGIMRIFNQSWWCGYGPYTAPSIVVCAVIENGGEGSTVGARCCSGSTPSTARPRAPTCWPVQASPPARAPGRRRCGAAGPYRWDRPSSGRNRRPAPPHAAAAGCVSPARAGRCPWPSG